MPSKINDRSVISTSGFGVLTILCGSRNTPCSSRLYHMQYPERSQNMILTRSPLRLKNTNKCPDRGSWPMFSLVIIANPSKLRRISVGCVETNIRTVEGQVSMMIPPLQSDASGHLNRNRSQLGLPDLGIARPRRSRHGLHVREEHRVLPQIASYWKGRSVAVCWQKVYLEPSPSPEDASSTSGKPQPRVCSGGNIPPGSSHS